ncbi:acyltransferase family protein [Streptococcus pluranimalium]|uniref:acyltransferase family protein n=1 Tax=Streptococcus pluranimalium TaxID=82348 RepID=UPI003F669842
MTQHNKIKSISFLQVIGPLLVILGHSLNGFPNGFYFWHVLSKDWIYLFHMPLFFFISGYLFTKSSKKYQFVPFIKNKVNRLLLPYLLFNLIFILPKLILGSIVNDRISLNFTKLLVMFLTPRENVWGHTWFMFCLFLVYALYYFWKIIINKKLWLPTSFFLLFIAAMSPKIYFLTISDFTFNLLFFFLGIIIFHYRDKFSNANLHKILLISLVVIILSALLYPFYEIKLVRIFLAIAIILTLYLLGNIFEFKSDLAAFISINSFWIYLLHWPFMLLTRVLLTFFGLNPVIIILGMIFAGIFGPIITIKLYKEFIYARYTNHF